MNDSDLLDKPIPRWIIIILVIYSVICFSIETLPELSPQTILFLQYSELIIVIIFSAEYFYRIYTAPNKLRFIFSFYGVIDLLAILPFYLSTAIDLRSLRLLRLLRLFKLTRYNQAANRFLQALYISKEELSIFIVASFMMLYLSAVGIYHFEHAAQPEVFSSIFDCLWWAVATLTTVGYGDIYPITVGGRLFTFIILILGLGLVAVPTGIVASSLSSIKRKE